MSSRVIPTVICFSLLACLFVGEASAQQWKDLEQSLEGREFIMRPTVEGRRKIYIQAGDFEAFALHRSNRLFPLRESEPVRIVDTDADNDHIELEVVSDRLGRGRIDFYGSPPSVSSFEMWLDEVFEVTTLESDFHRYIGNRESRTLHFRGANHLPLVASREPFHHIEDGLDIGYNRCGVCFVPLPDVSNYGTEFQLALFSLQQVRSTYSPHIDIDRQNQFKRIGLRVLEGWPVPLKGYRYRFQVVEDDAINAFAIPTGYIFITRGLFDSLETEGELEAVLAHEIAHVENRHTYRQFRNSQNISRWAGIATAILTGAIDEEVGDIASAMLSITTNIFLAGHGRDREREADLLASFYLYNREIGDKPLLNVFKKLKFNADLYNPFGDGGGGMLASHPHIEERLAKAAATITEPFSAGEVFQGFNDRGVLVATLRFDVQRLFDRELDVVATLSTTAELGDDDKVNTLKVRVNGKQLELKERTAERIFPSDEVAAVFGNDNVAGIIQEPIESIELKLKNVKRWARVLVSSVDSE